MKKSGRRRARFFLAAAFLLVGMGCRSSSTASPGQDRPLVVGLEAAPLNLDPRLAQDAHSERIVPLIYERLFALNQQAEPEPELVERAEHPDPLTWILSIRPGHRFSDGSPLTAEDVVFTFQSLADARLKSPKKYITDRIETLAALDPHTVLFRLKEPYTPLLHELTVGIVPEGWERANAGGTLAIPPGSGPYEVERFEPGEKVVLRRNPHYWGARPAIGRIVFRVLEDDVTRVMALEKGEVHLLQNCTPPDDLPLIARHPRLQLMEQPGINYSYLGLNLEDPILRDRRVRQAIALALDREQIASCLLRGTVTLASGLLAPSHWAYNGEVMVYPYDPARARALLDEAGYPDPDGDGPLPRFRLLYKTSTLKERRWIAAAIAEQLRAVGMEVEVRALEFGTFFNDIRAGRFQLYSLTWPGPTEPDLYYYIFHSASSPPHGANRNHYSNPELDRLAEQGRRTADRAERKKIYGRIQEIVAEDLPYISLWYAKNTAAMDRRLQGFVFFPGGDYRSLAWMVWKE